MTLRERIIELHERGLSIEEICKAVGSSTLIVVYIIREVTDPDYHWDY